MTPAVRTQRSRPSAGARPTDEPRPADEPRYAADVAAIRAAEQRLFAEVGDAAVMQTAAAGLAAALIDELHDLGAGTYGAQVLVLAGGGNNGGDALYAGQRLARRGVRVWLCRTGDRVHEAGWSAAVAAGARPVGLDHAERLLGTDDLDVVVDGILGIGGRPGLDATAARLARVAAAGPARVVAVDLPSGLDADRPGRPDDAFTADLTVTFGGAKPCHLTQPARSACGRLRVVELGLTGVDVALEAWSPADVAAVWPVPGVASDKYSRGVVGIDAGSDTYPGAGVLTTTGAVYAGAGMVRFTGADHPREVIMAQMPNVVTAEGRVQAQVLGSGWGEREDARLVIESTLASGVATVIDADALRSLPSGRLDGTVLLTPHAGELARLLRTDRSEVAADPVAAVGEAVARTGATVLLKGATQYVAAPASDGTGSRWSPQAGDEPRWQHDAATPPVGLAVAGPGWTGQAGSGDVLAGICGTLLAAGLTPRQAGLAGASIQALAARAAPGPYPPYELARRLPSVIADLLAGS